MNIEKFRITLNSVCILIVAIIAVISFSWSYPREEKDDGLYDTAEEYKNKSIEIFSEYLIKDLQTLGKLKIEVEDKVFINGIIY